ncbi:helix-turn-helix domain-containing protein [Saccharopolyspora rhizosphaerae]|uniref:Helix-turn-helix domain-containing protein n=1 Tax=Saccharopolyspora rhizosphaerae TaxID=2492662 RepID=A0A426JV23_9PSEU|nr:helix-turn-helix domain-containing protein [Saccharopolyspora rhizosphaerae]RRO17006.1 helix-turn-helix domain-containing protein [Saccharopolyspora rhizosphaerae]
MSNKEPLLTSAQVARELGVAAGTVARWVRAGWLTATSTTAGGQSRFLLSEVKEQLKARHLERDT